MQYRSDLLVTNYVTVSKNECLNRDVTQFFLYIIIVTSQGHNIVFLENPLY